MEELLGVRVLEDAVGFATEETFEATALGVFLFPIFSFSFSFSFSMVVDSRCSDGAWTVQHEEGLTSNMSCSFP